MPASVVVPVKQRTPEWVEAKKAGIGSSQAAASLGMSQWQSQISLWAEFLGLTPPPDETLPMRIGSELEPLIAKLYTEATGVKVRRVNHLRQHPTYRFMLASVDRRAGKRLVELKYSHRGTGYGEPGTDEVPDEALVQVLHQMAVMDVDEADVAVVIGGKHELQIYTVRRDATAEAAIVEREGVFWDHVLSRTEPPIDGSEATLQALSKIYPRDDGEVIEADEATRLQLVRLGRERAHIAAAEAGAAEARAALEAFMGPASKLVAPGIGQVTWKAAKDSEIVDWQALATVYGKTVDTLVGALRGRTSELELEGIDVSTDEGLEQVHAALRSLYTTTRPGSRRFLPKFEEE